MPVQFTCSNCHRTLSVGRRKAGTIVACPKCGQSTAVPALDGSEGAPLEEAKTELAARDSSETDSSLAAGAFDDILELIDQGPPAIPPSAIPPSAIPPSAIPPPADPPPADPPPAIPPPVAATPLATVSAPPPLPDLQPVGEERIESLVAQPVASRSAPPRRARRQDGAVLLLTRQAVYAQGGLMAGLALLAFLAGWLIGRGGQPAIEPTAAPPAEPVALEGHVLYAISPSESLADEGAVVIALPTDKRPDHKIAARGLRSVEADELDAAPSTDALRTIGAAVARVDGDGQFQLVVPRPGSYSLLIVSRRANRPDDLAISQDDLKELGEYFASPAELIGPKHYVLLVRRLSGASPSLTHEFRPRE